MLSISQFPLDSSFFHQAKISSMSQLKKIYHLGWGGSENVLSFNSWWIMDFLQVRSTQCNPSCSFLVVWKMIHTRHSSVFLCLTLASGHKHPPTWTTNNKTKTESKTFKPLTVTKVKTNAAADQLVWWFVAQLVKRLCLALLALSRLIQHFWDLHDLPQSWSLYGFSVKHVSFKWYISPSFWEFIRYGNFPCSSKDASRLRKNHQT